LQLFALAYNLGNFLRQLALPRSVRPWTTTTLREKLIKIGAKVLHQARSVTFQLAEVVVPRAVRGDPGSNRSAASGGEPRVIVRRGRMRVARSRGGRGWPAVRSGRRAEDRVERGRRGVCSGSRLAGRPKLANFPLTREYVQCPIRVQESRAMSRPSRST